MMQEIKIGIDFGTFSARAETHGAAVQKFEVSCNVSFEKCKFFPPYNYNKNTIYDIKKLIGLKYDECIKYQDKYPFKFVKSDTNNRAKVEVFFNGENTKFYIEEIYAMILRELVKGLETKTKMKVKGAVIAIPSYYTDIQRHAVLEAAHIANLNDVQLINESTAITIAFTAKNRPLNNNVLIIDMGADKFELALVKIVNKNIEVLMNGVMNDFGGNDFTNSLVNYCIRKIEENNPHMKVTKNNENLLTLLFDECEMAKKSSMEIETTYIALDRNIFFTECQHLFEKFETFLIKFKEEIQNANYSIDCIVEAGQSIGLLGIREGVKKVFKEKLLLDCKWICMDEVASGASYFASRNIFSLEDIISKDVIICDNDKPEENEPSICKYSKIGKSYWFHLKGKHRKSCKSSGSSSSNLVEKPIVSPGSNDSLSKVTINCFVNIRLGRKVDEMMFHVYESFASEYKKICTLKANQHRTKGFGLMFNSNGILEVSNEMNVQYSVDRIGSQELELLKKRQDEIFNYFIEYEILEPKKENLILFCQDVIEISKSYIKDLNKEDMVKLNEYYNSAIKQIRSKSTLSELELTESDLAKRILEFISPVYHQNSDSVEVSDLFHRLKQCRAVAIDFGTAYSRIAVRIDTKQELITNYIGEYATPNCIYINENQQAFFGESAIALDSNNGKLIYNMKRDLLNNKHNNFDYTKWISFIFHHLKQFARNYLNLNDCPAIETLYVFTVPNTNDAYKNVIQRSIELCGIKRSCFLNEQTAIAIYDAFKCFWSDLLRNVLIIDIGASKCEMSLFTIQELNVKEIFSLCDTKVCGEEITSILVNYCKSEIIKDTRLKTNPNENDKTLFRLRNACEKAKQDLSFKTNVQITNNDLSQGFTFTIPINRDKFETLCIGLFKQYDDLLDRLPQNVIKKVLFTGGSSKIPKIKEITKRRFSNRAEIFELEAEAVVKGAAIYAAFRNGDKLRSTIKI